MTPTEIRLRAELRDARALVAAQHERLDALQAANEGAYRDAYDTQGGPHHCTARPFGEPVDRDEKTRLAAMAAAETNPGRRAAWRTILNRTPEDQS